MDRLAAAISARGVPTVALGEVDEIVAGVVAEARPGDVVVAMSNGAFGGIWTRLLDGLRAKGS